MLSDADLQAILDADDHEHRGGAGPEMRLLEIAQAIQRAVRTDMLREILAVEQADPATFPASVIPHLTEVDLGACNARDEQIAAPLVAHISELEEELLDLRAIVQSIEGGVPVRTGPATYPLVEPPVTADIADELAHFRARLAAKRGEKP